MKVPLAVGYDALATRGRAAAWDEVGERLAQVAAECGVPRAVHVILREGARSPDRELRILTHDGSGPALLTQASTIAPGDRCADLFDRVGTCHWRADDAGFAAIVADVTGLGIAAEEMRHGWAAPVRGLGSRGLLIAASTVDPATTGEAGRRFGAWLQIFAFEFHRTVTALLDGAETKAIVLPPRGFEVLKAASAGLTAQETAARLELSPATVESYLRETIRRLGCINKTHAVAEAIRRGLF